MILIDTNVLSEAWKPVPDRRVMAWIDAQAVDTMFLSTVTVAELRFGIAVMPVGRRREIMRRRLEDDVLPVFEGRILSFDLRAAQAYADARASAKVAGRAIAAADGYIAATALAHSLAVATRYTGPFEAAGLTTINPWDAQARANIVAPRAQLSASHVEPGSGAKGALRSSSMSARASKATKSAESMRSAIAR